MAKTREEGLAIETKWRLLEKVIVETGSGNIQWEYAFNPMFTDYYAEWQGRILTIRSLQDEGPRLRVFTSLDKAIPTYHPDRNAISLPVEDDALVTCWERELSEMNRTLCCGIANYLKPEEREGDKESAQEREQRRQDKAREHSAEELREIKKILGE